MFNNKHIKEISNFLIQESSIIERGKKYHTDVAYLLDEIARLQSYNYYRDTTISTAKISGERADKLLIDILALVNQYYDEPKVCG